MVKGKDPQRTIDLSKVIEQVSADLGTELSWLPAAKPC